MISDKIIQMNPFHYLCLDTGPVLNAPAIRFPCLIRSLDGYWVLHYDKYLINQIHDKNHEWCEFIRGTGTVEEGQERNCTTE